MYRSRAIEGFVSVRMFKCEGDCVVKPLSWALHNFYVERNSICFFVSA